MAQQPFHKWPNCKRIFLVARRYVSLMNEIQKAKPDAEVETGRGKGGGRAGVISMTVLNSEGGAQDASSESGDDTEDKGGKDEEEKGGKGKEGEKMVTVMKGDESDRMEKRKEGGKGRGGGGVRREGVRETEARAFFERQRQLNSNLGGAGSSSNSNSMVVNCLDRRAKGNGEVGMGARGEERDEDKDKGIRRGEGSMLGKRAKEEDDAQGGNKAARGREFAGVVVRETEYCDDDGEDDDVGGDFGEKGGGEDELTPSKRTYKCHTCGQPKKNHVCPGRPIVSVVSYDEERARVNDGQADDNEGGEPVDRFVKVKLNAGHDRKFQEGARAFVCSEHRDASGQRRVDVSETFSPPGKAASGMPFVFVAWLEERDIMRLRPAEECNHLNPELLVGSAIFIQGEHVATILEVCQPPFD